MTATTCTCGHDAARHPAVYVRDNGGPTFEVTRCGLCDCAGYLPVLPDPTEPVNGGVFLDATVEPLEERLRSVLVGTGLAALGLAVVLVAAAFGFAVAARWAGTPRPLDGTAVLCALAAVVAGVAGRYAIAVGVRRPDDAPTVLDLGEPVDGFVDGPRLPPTSESGVSRSADGTAR